MAYIQKDGSVTGSINWAQLEAQAKDRNVEGVSDEGWANVQALVDGHRNEVKSAAEQEESRRVAAEEATAAALAAPDATEAVVESDDGDEEPGLTKAELQDALRERGLPTTGNKAELQERLDEDGS